jgi:hypothetical protein
MKKNLTQIYEELSKDIKTWREIMFFHISRSKQDNFPNHHQTKHFVINLDDGWTQVQDYLGNDIWYKGYLDDAPLAWFAVRISEETVPTYSGNFCVIKVTAHGLSIRTDKSRSFPIWYDYEQGLTNLRQLGAVQWTSDLVDITNDWVLVHSKYDPIGPVDGTILDFTEVVDQVDALLSKKTVEFVQQLDRPLRVFLTGGIDTVTLFSYIQKYTDQYQIINCNYIHNDYFYLKNHGYLNKFWAYNQIHYWTEPCVLASGSPGDEFSCRNPITVDMLLRYHGSSFVEVFNDPDYSNSLNYNSFKQGYIDKLTKNPSMPKQDSFDAVIRDCCEININDWQHWHLGRTLTWTPFRDIEMFKLFARLQLPYLKQQLMDAAVQKELIRRNDPELLNLLSSQKNSLNYMENLVNFQQLISH